MNHHSYCVLIIILSLTLALIPSVRCETPPLQEAAKLELRISARPLSRALTKLAADADVQIVYSSDDVKNLSVGDIEGSFTLEEALKLMLGETELEYTFLDTESIVVKSKPLKTEPTPPPSEPQATQPRALPIVQPRSSLEVVVVTGSRLLRSSFQSPYPTQSIGEMVLKQEAHTTIADAINTLPIMCDPSFSINSPGEENAGKSFGDLYCLGSQRTLTLINGKRSVSSNEPNFRNDELGLQVDLNMIPRIMIGNIEVIGVGSAPVYGSDAIGGTINVQLKDQFDGIEIDLQQGVSELEDGEQTNVGILYGKTFSNADSRFILGYEYHRQEGVIGNDRDFTARNQQYIFVTPQDPQSPDFVLAQDVANPLITINGIPTPAGNDFPRFSGETNRIIDDSGRPLTFDANGRLTPFDLGDITLDLNRRVGGEGTRLSNSQQLRTPFERHALSGAFRANILGSVDVISEAQFYRGKFSTLGRVREPVGSAANPSFNSLPVTTDNPFLHPADVAFLESGALAPIGSDSSNTFYLHKDWSAVFDPTVDAETTIGRFVLGFDGAFSFFDNDWSWESSAIYGNSATRSETRRANNARFLQATLTSPEEPCTGDCILLNPFGENPGKDAIQYISEYVENKSDIAQGIFHINTRGDVTTLHGGGLQIVIGAETRVEQAEIIRSQSDIESRLLEPVDGMQGGNSTRRDGLKEFDTKEVFIESIAPVIGEGLVPGLKQLELEANWRGVAHSVAGDDDAWAVATRMSISPFFLPGTLLFRANLTNSIRSPSLLELFQPLTPVTTTVNDPCDRDFVNTGVHPTLRRENCIEDAATFAIDPTSPTTNPDPSSVYDSETFESQVPRLAPISLAGTASLSNEQARATTGGFVYRSGEDAHFQLSVDTLDIEVKDAIVQRDLQRLLNNCYDTDERIGCNDIARTSEFQLSGIFNSYENLGSIRLKANQYLLKYNIHSLSWFDLPGELTAELSAYQLNEFIVDNGNELRDLAGYVGHPEYRLNSAIRYTSELLDLSWSTQYTSAVDFDLPLSSADISPKIEPYTYHIVSAGFQITNYLYLRAGIQNVFDSSPPTSLPSSAVNARYDPIGRYYSIGMQLNFE